MILNGLPDAALDRLLEQVGPAAPEAIAMVELRHLTGAVGRVDPKGGALDQLPGQFLVMAGNVTPTPDAVAVAQTQTAALREALSPWVNDRDYLNFRERVVAPRRFFDGRTRARLAAVKARVDPEDVIQPNHVTWEAPQGAASQAW
jgi:hypothetical protein